ncbi:MAG: NfeD family protein [Clostridium sp.]|nr:NfeD family protein [Clostridium sp.]MCM1444359.1 NfeD family protein [Candidatus Amulumruptor caecigallinarius]
MLFWLIIIVFLSFIEIATTSLTTIWFIASALVALIISIFTNLFLVQFATFVLLGTLLLITTRKTLLKVFKEKKEETNIERILMMNGIVTEEIQKNSIGEVKIDGKKWSAYSDSSIPVGAIVKVLKIDSVKLKVEKVEG